MILIIISLIQAITQEQIHKGFMSDIRPREMRHLSCDTVSLCLNCISTVFVLYFLPPSLWHCPCVTFPNFFLLSHFPTHMSRVVALTVVLTVVLAVVQPVLPTLVLPWKGPIDSKMEQAKISFISLFQLQFRLWYRHTWALCAPLDGQIWSQKSHLNSRLPRCFTLTCSFTL